MCHIPTDQYFPSGRGEFTVRGVAEALKFTSLAIATIKKKAGNSIVLLKL